MRLRALLVAFSLFVLSLPLSIPVAAQIETRPILSSSAAMTMVHGCLSKAAAEGWLMHIAIMDNHVRQPAFLRGMGAVLHHCQSWTMMGHPGIAGCVT